MENKNRQPIAPKQPEARSRIHNLMSQGSKPIFRSTPEYVRINLERMRKSYEKSLERAENLGITKNGILICADGKGRSFEKWDKIAERILASAELQQLIASLETDDTCLPFITADFSQAPLKQVIDTINKKEYGGLEEEITGLPPTPFDPNGLNAKPAKDKLGVIFIDNGYEVPQQTVGMSPYHFAEFCRASGYHMTDAQNRAMMRGKRENETLGMLSNSDGHYMAYSHSSPTTDLRFGLLNCDFAQPHVGGRRQVKVD